MKLIADSHRKGSYKLPVALSPESIILKILTQNATTNDWAMDVNMDQCGITPKSDNTSIYFPLTIQAESADPNAIIYRETPGFEIGFKCYFQREIKFKLFRKPYTVMYTRANYLSSVK